MSVSLLKNSPSLLDTFHPNWTSLEADREARRAANCLSPRALHPTTEMARDLSAEASTPRATLGLPQQATFITVDLNRTTLLGQQPPSCTACHQLLPHTSQQLDNSLSPMLTCPQRSPLSALTANTSPALAVLQPLPPQLRTCRLTMPAVRTQPPAGTHPSTPMATLHPLACTCSHLTVNKPSLTTLLVVATASAIAASKARLNAESIPETTSTISTLRFRVLAWR